MPCIVCKDGNEPTGHHLCVSCKKKVHAIEGGCSVSVDMDGEKRLCLECAAKTDGRIVQESDKDKDNFIVVYFENKNSMSCKRVIPRKWADEKLVEFDFPTRLFNPREVINIDISKVKKERYIIDQHFGPFDNFDDAQNFSKSYRPPYNESETLKYIYKSVNEIGSKADTMVNQKESNEDNGMDIDKKSGCRKTEQNKKSKENFLGKFIIVHFTASKEKYKQIIPTKWANQSLSEFRFPQKRITSGQHMADVDLNNMLTWRYDIDRYFGPFDTYKEAEEFEKNSSSCDSSVDTDEVTKYVESKQQYRGKRIIKRNFKDDFVYEDHFGAKQKKSAISNEEKSVYDEVGTSSSKDNLEENCIATSQKKKDIGATTESVNNDGNSSEADSENEQQFQTCANDRIDKSKNKGKENVKQKQNSGKRAWSKSNTKQRDAVHSESSDSEAVDYGFIKDFSAPPSKKNDSRSTAKTGGDFLAKLKNVKSLIDHDTSDEDGSENSGNEMDSDSEKISPTAKSHTVKINDKENVKKSSIHERSSKAASPKKRNRSDSEASEQQDFAEVSEQSPPRRDMEVGRKRRRNNSQSRILSPRAEKNSPAGTSAAAKTPEKRNVGKPDKRVMNKLNKIMFLLEGKKGCGEEPNYDLLPEFELEKPEQFENFENQLKTDPRSREQFRSFLRNKGGKDFKNMLERCFSSVFTKSAIEDNYSWTGVRRRDCNPKKSFKKLEMTKIIISVVQHQMSVTEDKVEKAAMSYIQHIKDKA